MKLLFQEQGLQKVCRDLVTMATHHKMERTLVVLAQEWEVEVR